MDIGGRARNIFAAEVLQPIRGTTVSKGLEVIASATSIVLFGGAIAGLAHHAAVWSIILIIWVCSMATVAFVLLYVQEHRVWRRTRYATSVDKTHDVQHSIRDGAASLLLRDAQREDVLQSVVTALSALADAFTIITGNPCRASIKEVSRADATNAPTQVELRKLEVTTLARSGGQATAADNLTHYVDQNTDFESFFLTPGQRWFMSNDLTTLEHYKNSSWMADGPRDYQATCVWPIEKREIGTPAHDVLGFLCVDTREVDVFDRRFDFWVGAGVADSLYSLLKLLRLQAEGMRFVIDNQEVV